MTTRKKAKTISHAKAGELMSNAYCEARKKHDAAKTQNERDLILEKFKKELKRIESRTKPY